MLDLIIALLGGRAASQDQLTEDQLEAIGEQLIKGEVGAAQAFELLKHQAEQGDLRAVRTTMEYLVALGMDGRRVLEMAATFFMTHRHYVEAHRYAQTLCYEHDRYGAALKRLAILDTLLGDYAMALVHLDEFVQNNKPDLDVLWFKLDAMFRSGALMAARSLSQETGMRPELEAFLGRRLGGKNLGRFSWHGTPVSPGTAVNGFLPERMQTLAKGLLKQPLQREVQDFESLDALINTGTYVSDLTQYEDLSEWVLSATFEVTLTGDSDEFAMWAWVQLCRLGYPARLMVGGLYQERPNHAWVTVHRGQSVQVLECTPQGFNPLINARNAIEYRPLWSVDRSLYCYRH